MSSDSKSGASSGQISEDNIKTDFANVNYDKPGKYTAFYTCTNPINGMSATKGRHIIVGNADA